MTCDRFFLQNLWRDLADLPEVDITTLFHIPSYDSLVKTEWSSEFEENRWGPHNEEFKQFRLNRMVQGAFRYGLHKSPTKPSWERIYDAKARALKYKETGDIELLLDIANDAELEYSEGTYPDKCDKDRNDGITDKLLQYDCVPTIVLAADLYLSTHNIRYLYMIANYAEREYVYGRHSNRHFGSTTGEIHNER